MSLPIVLLVVGVGLILYLVGVYNSLQQLKTQIAASVQEIGNQLKRQASLLPNLESAVKGYLKHEKGIFQMLTDARKSVAQAEKTGQAQDIDRAIDSLTKVVPQIRVAVEDNPELKADQTVTKFMDELRDTADKLMYARRSVIDLSQSYNVKLVTFPTNVIASSFGFTKEKGLEMPTGGSHLKVAEKEMTDFQTNL